MDVVLLLIWQRDVNHCRSKRFIVVKKKLMAESGHLNTKYNNVLFCDVCVCQNVRFILEIELIYHKELRGRQFLWQLRLCRSRASLLFSENTRWCSNINRLVLICKRVSLSCCSFTLKRSKLVFRSLGLRSPCRQTQESWWPLLSGPKEKREDLSSFYKCITGITVEPEWYQCLLPPPCWIKYCSMLSQSILVRQKTMAWSILCSLMALTVYSPFSTLMASDHISKTHT